MLVAPAWDDHNFILSTLFSNTMNFNQPLITQKNPFTKKVEEAKLKPLEQEVLNIIIKAIVDQSKAKNEIIQASSVVKKRRRRMNHHKYKKWLKKMRFRLKAEGRK